MLSWLGSLQRHNRLSVWLVVRHVGSTEWMNEEEEEVAKVEEEESIHSLGP